MGNDDSGHPLIEFAQGFLEGMEQNQGSVDTVEDTGRGRRSIPDPPSLQDIDVSPPRRESNRETETVEIFETGGGSTAGGIDMDFRPEEGVSRADFESMYERNIVNVNARDQWVKWLDPHEYLDRSDLRSHNSDGRMYDFVYEKCKEILDGEIMMDIRRRPASEYGNTGGRKEGSGGQDLNYSDLSPEELLSLLGQMVEEGRISKMEAESLLMKVKENGQEPTRRDKGVSGGAGGDGSELDKLDEMLDRFQS